MNTSMGMAVSLLSLLVVAGGILATLVSKAYAKVPHRSIRTTTFTITKGYSGTSTNTELAIAKFFVVKYCTQAMVSGHYQAAKNLRKQGVPLETAMMILFGNRRDCAA